MSMYPEITRAIKSTVANILFVNLDTTETFTREINLAGTYKTYDQLLKAVPYDSEHEKPVMVKDSTVDEKLYGMSQNDFMKYGKVYPPRVRNTVSE